MRSYWKCPTPKTEAVSFDGVVEICDNVATYYQFWPDRSRTTQFEGVANWEEWAPQYWVPADIDEDYLMDVGL